MTTIFETERLVFRQFELTDADFIITLLNTKEWIQFIGDREVRTEKDAHQYLLNGPMKSYELNGFGLSMVALKVKDSPIGMCGLIKRDSLDDIDIGFAFLPEYTGKGYAYEIASATIAYAKNKFGLKRLVAITVKDNARSITLLKRTGMEFEKTIQPDNEELMLFGMSL